MAEPRGLLGFRDAYLGRPNAAAIWSAGMQYRDLREPVEISCMRREEDAADAAHGVSSQLEPWRPGGC
jgi:hypothetical protein